MRTFVVEEPIFKTATLFVLGCDFETFTRFMQRRYHCETAENTGQCGQMFTYKSNAPWRVVWSKDMDLPVILHEVFHLVTRILQDKGVPIRAHDERGDFGDETAAYLFAFYVQALSNHRVYRR